MTRDELREAVARSIGNESGESDLGDQWTLYAREADAALSVIGKACAEVIRARGMPGDSWLWVLENCERDVLTLTGAAPDA